MSDCFISYSKTNESLARRVYDELTRHNVSCFLACASIGVGQKWSPEIINNLKAASWVIVLASQEACQSAFVNQEIGAALIASKRIVPIVWDIPPSELPGWLHEFQAISFAGATYAQQQQKVQSIAKNIRQDKEKGLLIIGAIGFALIAAGILLTDEK